MEEEKLQLQQALKMVQDIEYKIQQKLLIADDIRKNISKIDNIEYIEKVKSRCIEYLENFDKECKTNARNLINEVPLLIAIYEDFVQELIQPTAISKKAEKESQRIKDELINTLEPQQIKLFKEAEDIEENLSDERERQAYIYGYIISTIQKQEAIK